MKKLALLAICFVICILVGLPAFAGVNISSPGNGSTVGSSVNFVASGNSSCPQGVGSMGIYPAPYQLAYVANGSYLNTSLNLNPGTYNVVVVEWDNCGGATTSGVTIYVKSGQSGQSGVSVTSPANNSTVGAPTNFAATATSACPSGVASMGIYTGPGQLA